MIVHLGVRLGAKCATLEKPPIPLGLREQGWGPGITVSHLESFIGNRVLQGLRLDRDGVTALVALGPGLGRDILAWRT